MTKYLKPNHINKFYIYDIFYNDIKQLVIIMPAVMKITPIYYISDDNTMLPFHLYKCPHNHIYIYTLDVEYTYTIKLEINNEIIETYVNRYPSFKNEIIFSTEVKDEDEYIKPWIDFHLKLGITRFIIYDNSEKGTLPDILQEFLEKEIVILIKWEYPLILPNRSGRTGQITQQNHSIYAFRKSKYIGLFDIDEYINIQNKNNLNINSFLENVITEENININDIGSFRMLNKFFYNPNNLPTDGDNFLKIFNCDKINLYGQEKNFVIPTNVDTFSVHMITEGKPMKTLDCNKIYFNHYYFLNKTDRGRNKTDLIDSSILNFTN